MYEQLVAIVDETDDRPIAITGSRIRGWHRVLFKDDFRSAGQFRTGIAEFGIRWYSVPGDLGLKWCRGADPARITGELDEAAAEFQGFVASARSRPFSTREACEACAALYASVVAIHPFMDGNGRTAWVVLTAALLSAGLDPVIFDRDLSEHNRRLALAVPRVHGTGERVDVRPFAELLATLLGGSPVR